MRGRAGQGRERWAGGVGWPWRWRNVLQWRNIDHSDDSLGDIKDKNLFCVCTSPNFAGLPSLIESTGKLQVLLLQLLCSTGLPGDSMAASVLGITVSYDRLTSGTVMEAHKR